MTVVNNVISIRNVSTSYSVLKPFTSLNSKTNSVKFLLKIKQMYLETLTVG